MWHPPATTMRPQRNGIHRWVTLYSIGSRNSKTQTISCTLSSETKPNRRGCPLATRNSASHETKRHETKPPNSSSSSNVHNRSPEKRLSSVSACLHEREMVFDPTSSKVLSAFARPENGFKTGFQTTSVVAFLPAPRKLVSKPLFGHQNLFSL